MTILENIKVQLPSTMLSVKQAADIIGVTTGRVRQMLIAGTLVGVKFNERAWIVDQTSAMKVAENIPLVGRRRTAEKNL